MNAPGSDPAKKDLRPLALLLFALCILVAAALRAGLFSSLPAREPHLPQQLVWRDDPAAAAPGLYRLEPVFPAEQAAPSPVPPPARLAPLFFNPIDVNRADAELLATISGIGPALARRIIAFRDQQGGITAIEELDAVQGIGPAKLEILKAHLVAN